MTKNPFINAFAAVAYIATIASLVIYTEPFVKSLPLSNVPIVFAPIAMLSLFVFSAAVMGYIFLYNPILLVLDNKRKEGTMLFLQTVGTFAATAIIFITLGLLATSAF